MPLRGTLLAPALLGAVAVLLATATYGPGLTPDSANYFSAAESLAAGQGLLDVTGQPLAHFPPAFPAALSVFAAAGVDAGTATRLLNAL